MIVPSEVCPSLMEDDLVASLTRQVKEEVIENYLLERRLIELQSEHLNSQADDIRRQARVVGRRLTRLSFLMTHSDMRRRLREMLGMEAGFWDDCLNVMFTRKVPLIRMRALTQKRKFLKLMLESYSRLHFWMKKYKQRYDDLANEHAAVNRNIDAFQKNFDLLAILNFLRNLDMQGIANKKILGDNFTAQEIAELDNNLDACRK